MDDSTCRSDRHQRLGIAVVLVLEAARELLEMDVVDALRSGAASERVDEEAVTLVGRHAPAEVLRRGHEAVFLEVGHHVAHRGPR